MTALLNANHCSLFQSNMMINTAPLPETVVPETEAPRRVSLDENCLRDILVNFMEVENQPQHNKRKRVVEPEEEPIILKKPKRKLLRFLAEPIVVGTASAFEQKSDVWYSREELSDIRKDAKIAVLKSTAAHEISNLYHDTTSSENVSQEFMSLRGLERWTSKKHYQARQVQAKSLRSELWIEQSTQRYLTGCDPERLATISRSHSASAVLWARRLAQIDAQQDDF